MPRKQATPSPAEPPATGSYGSIDWGKEKGVQTWEEAFGKRPSEKKGLRLAYLLEQLADELRAAKNAAKRDGKEDILQVKECSLELGMTWEVTANAGVKFWVFEIGGDASKSNTQTITIALEPVEGIGPISFLHAPDLARLKMEEGGTLEVDEDENS